MKRKLTLSIISVFLGLSGCKLSLKEDIQIDTKSTAGDHIQKKAVAISEGNWNDVLKLAGDFNGDGRTDTIYEVYISGRTGKNTNKNFGSEDYEQEIEKIVANQPICKIRTTIPDIPLYLVTDDPQQTGIAEFENLGDLNNDGADEIGYVVRWADFSNINSYHIISLSGNRFKEIYSFPINEAINSEEEYLFVNNSIIQKTGAKTFKHKYYSDDAEVKENEVTLE